MPPGGRKNAKSRFEAHEAADRHEPVAAMVRSLAGSRIEAEHWSQVGAATASDVDIMQHAKHYGSVVLTHDLDFGAILAATKGRGPSVIQLRADDTSPEANLATLAAAVRRCEAELDAGALLTVDVGRARVTLLPLRS